MAECGFSRDYTKQFKQNFFFTQGRSWNYRRRRISFAPTFSIRMDALQASFSRVLPETAPKKQN